jgi:hypothetical protein
MMATRDVSPYYVFAWRFAFDNHVWGVFVTDITVGGGDIVISGCDFILRTGDITVINFIISAA